MSTVYFLRRANGDVKIGWASDVERRIAQLRAKHGTGLQLLAVFAGSHRSESLLHDRFAADRKDGEWFAPSEALGEVISACNAGHFSDPGAAPELPLSAIFDPHDGAWTAQEFCLVFRPLLVEMVEYRGRASHRLVAIDQIAASCGLSSSWLRKFVASSSIVSSIKAQAAINILAAYRSHQAQVRSDAAEAIRIASLRQADAERAIACLWPSGLPDAGADTDLTDLPLWRAASEGE